MVEDQPSPSARRLGRRRSRQGTRRRTPGWALAVLLVVSGLLVPLFLLGNSEDRAFSASASATQSPGGETHSSYYRGSTTYTCRDAPLRFVVDGEPYAGTEVTSGTCVPAGQTRSVTVRYDPDDPGHFTTQGRQWVLYGFVAAAALGFLATSVAVLLRLRARWRRPARA